MLTSRTHHPRVPMAFEPDPRPNAESFVYCKGCGQPLEGEARHQQPKVKVVVMMCEACREIHGHPLVPLSGTPTFCYRCGTKDEIFIEPGTWPVTHHVCPRCMPDRAARYREGNFEPEEPATPA